MSTTVVTFRPQGAAAELFRARDPELLLSGPAGTGKSRACLEKMHLAACRHAGSRWLMVRKTRVSLTQSGMVTFARKVLHPLDGVAFRAQEQEYRYPNGSVVVVSGLDEPSRIQSAEYDCAYVQEATELEETDWETILSRLRYGAMPYQQVVADCNPASNQHWLYRRAQAGLTRMLESRHEDNPELWDGAGWTEFGAGYIGRLDRLTGFRRDRLRHGRWVGAEGLVYDGWDAASGARARDCAGWSTHLGVDVGSRNPTALMTVRLHDAFPPHVEGEWWGRDLSSSDILGAVARRAEAINPETIWVDPSAKSYIQDLERLGFRVRAANNDVLYGVGRVQEAVQAGMTVDPSCRHMLEELGLYRWQDKAEKDAPVKEHDHCLDAVRYVLASVDRDARPWIM